MKTQTIVFMSGFILFELVLNVLIIRTTSYTEIDWIAYNQEVEGFLGGEMDYVNLKGDTGPLVYPAGFVYLYSALNWITNGGSNILLAQYLFAGLYICMIAILFYIYKSSDSIPEWTFFVLCLSRRIHSIFVLRLFNDCWSAFFAYAAIALFIRNRWSLGCVLFSLAVSIKMSVLLFAPGLLILLIFRFGVLGSIPKLAICGIIQVLLGLPFLLTFPVSYLSRAFEFTRQFMYIWSVNFKFVSEETFLDRRLHLALLLLHLSLLTVSLYLLSRRLRSPKPGTNLNASHIVTVLFVSNFIGILCARSLHYQFYVWYFHTLPHLLWGCSRSVTSTQNNRPDAGSSFDSFSSAVRGIVGQSVAAVQRPSFLLRVLILAVIEYAWNVYPSTPLSSGALWGAHAVLLVFVLSPAILGSGSVGKDSRKVQ